MGQTGSENSKRTQPRERWLDVAKGIGILLVVLGHMDGPFFLNQVIYSFHMFFFFIISGYLYNEQKWNHATFGAVARRRAQDYLVPYLKYALLDVLLTEILFVCEKTEPNKMLESLPIFAKWVVFNLGADGQEPNCGPLWYLPCLFIAYLLFWMVRRQEDVRVRVGICLAFLLVNRLAAHTLTFSLPWHMEVAPLCSLFMVCGYWLKKADTASQPKRERRWAALLCVVWGVVLYFGSLRTHDVVDLRVNRVGNILLCFVGAVSATIALLVLCKNLPHNRFLAFVGENTILILGIHIVVSSFWKVWMQHMGWNDNWLIRYFAVCTICILICLLKYLIQEKRKLMAK